MIRNIYYVKLMLNLFLVDENVVWAWGYGRACGTRKNGDDWLFPQRVSLPRNNIIMVSGGQHHSMALTGRNIFEYLFQFGKFSSSFSSSGLQASPLCLFTGELH